MRIVVVGALGAVGGAVALSLADLGHEVIRVSSRAPFTVGGPLESVESVPFALTEIARGEVDLVIHAGGPGDNRLDRDTWQTTTNLFAACLMESGTRGILLSTTRVFEGHTDNYSENSDANVTTVYAERNARTEEIWLGKGGPSAVVLRLANFFSSPSTIDSPQAALLPWSLVTEALSTGAVGIRSGANFSKEFISALDIATAVLCISSASAVPSVTATVPGLTVSMADFAGVVQRAFARAELPVPEVSFGQDSAVAPRCASGWLTQSGWTVGLSLSAIEDAVAMWITSLNS